MPLDYDALESKRDPPEGPKCYCGSPTVLRSSKYGFFYGCTRWPGCDGKVGVHPGTTKPLGTVADKPTRFARSVAHATFDAIWQSDEGPSRGGAYQWLASRMSLDQQDCHIGQMDLEQCKRVVAIASQTTPAEVKDTLDRVNRAFKRVRQRHLRRLQRDMRHE